MMMMMIQNNKERDMHFVTKDSTGRPMMQANRIYIRYTLDLAVQVMTLLLLLILVISILTQQEKMLMTQSRKNVDND